MRLAATALVVALLGGVEVRAQSCATAPRPSAPPGVLPASVPSGLLQPGPPPAGGSVLTGGTRGNILRPPRAPLPGVWTILSDMPKHLGEVAAACVGDTIYVIGEGDDDTITLDLTTLNWSNTLADARLYAGDHQSIEVWGGKLYVIGGFGNGSQGKVQIYDPGSNIWAEGAPMPWNGGSVNTVLIGNKIYVAGGIVRNAFTTDQCGIYQPATDTWRPMASMPDGRNHAAAATDGERMWIFGGRGPGSGDTNTVANGFADLQVYDPETDTWESSNDPGSALVPLPIGRGGTGRAVYYRGEFHVLGGETLTGPGAEPGNVYDRVDVYCPVTHTWRQETDMPTARHGIFPVLVGNQLYVLGGGTNAGGSQSDVAEVMLLR